MSRYFFNHPLVPKELQDKIKQVLRAAQSKGVGTNVVEEVKDFVEDGKRIMSGSQAKAEAEKIIIKEIK